MARRRAVTFNDQIESLGVIGRLVRKALPEVSPTGQFVVFRSAATNLVAGDTNNLAVSNNG